MNDRHLHLLRSPGFLFGLSVLLLNDFVLKQQFHNGLTGKLSDFAGLFIFPLFWTALFPRLKISIYVLTAISFTLWKSAYSQPLIESWNGLVFFSIGRTVDYSDLVALSSLLLSFGYTDRAPQLRLPRSAVCVLGFISLLAFTATSFSKKIAYDNEYLFQNSKTELLERMSHLPVQDVNEHFAKSDTFAINFDSCNDYASITVGEKGTQSVITLKEMTYRCPTGGDKQEMLEYFENEFINKLREEPVTKSSQIEYIWPAIPDKRLQPTPR